FSELDQMGTLQDWLRLKAGVEARNLDWKFTVNQPNLLGSAELMTVAFRLDEKQDIQYFFALVKDKPEDCDEANEGKSDEERRAFGVLDTNQKRLCREF